MNDQHPHAGYAGDGAHTTGSFATDPLFGSYADGQADHSGQWNLGQYDATGTYGTTGQYDTTQYGATGTQYDTTGQWAAPGQWNTTGASGPTTGPYDTTPPSDAGATYDTTGQWDASAWTDAQHTGQYENAHSGAYAAQGAYGHEAYDATEAVGGRVARHLREHGEVITRFVGDQLVFAPPLSSTDDDINFLIDATATAIKAVTDA